MSGRGGEKKLYVEPPRSRAEHPLWLGTGIWVVVAGFLLVGMVTGHFGANTEITAYRVCVCSFIGFCFALPGYLGLYQAWVRWRLRIRDVRTWLDGDFLK